MTSSPVTPDTVNYLFWGYLAAFALLAIWVGRLAVRLTGLAKRMDRLQSPEPRAGRGDDRNRSGTPD